MRDTLRMSWPCLTRLLVMRMLRSVVSHATYFSEHVPVYVAEVVHIIIFEEVEIGYQVSPVIADGVGREVALAFQMQDEFVKVKFHGDRSGLGGDGFLGGFRSDIGLGVLAFRVARAGYEFTPSAGFDSHGLATFITGLINDFRLLARPRLP